VTKDFEFTHAGNTFICTVEQPRHAGMAPWWWFRLASETSTRYAPFEALPGDTKQSVQKRIIEYYAQLLEIKARPVHQRPFWRKPEPAAATDAATAPVPQG